MLALSGCKSTLEELLDQEIQSAHTKEEKKEYTVSFEADNPCTFAYDRLSETEQIWYRDINRLLAYRMDEDVKLSVEAMKEGLTEEDIDKIYNCVMMDHPEYFYVDGYEYGTYVNGVGDTLYYLMYGKYSYSMEECEKRREEIEEAAENILWFAPTGGDDYEKIRYVYETIIEQTDYDTNAEDIIIDFQTLGSGHKSLMTPHGGFRNRITPESFIQEDFGNGIIRAPKDTLIDGMSVLTFAISRPPKSIQQMIDDYNIDINTDIDYFLIHQANKLIVDRVVKKLKLPTEKVPYDLEEFGNLGGASIPSLMVTRTAGPMRGDKPIKMLCSSFGLGLSWGTMIISANNVVIPELVEI
jgi:hypothetical protein